MLLKGKCCIFWLQCWVLAWFGSNLLTILGKIGIFFPFGAIFPYGVRKFVRIYTHDVDFENFSDPNHKPWFWLINHKHFSLWRFYKTAKKLYRYNQDLSFELLIRDHEKAPRQLFHMSQCYLCSLNEPRNWF